MLAEDTLSHVLFIKITPIKYRILYKGTSKSFQKMELKVTCILCKKMFKFRIILGFLSIIHFIRKRKRRISIPRLPRASSYHLLLLNGHLSWITARARTWTMAPRKECVSSVRSLNFCNKLPQQLLLSPLTIDNIFSTLLLKTDEFTSCMFFHNKMFN